MTTVSLTNTVSWTQPATAGAACADDAGVLLPELDDDAADDFADDIVADDFVFSACPSPVLILSTSLSRSARRSSSSFFRRVLLPGLRSLEYLPSVLLIF